MEDIHYMILCWILSVFIGTPILYNIKRKFIVPLVYLALWIIFIEVITATSHGFLKLGGDGFFDFSGIGFWIFVYCGLPPFLFLLVICILSYIYPEKFK